MAVLRIFILCLLMCSIVSCSEDEDTSPSIPPVTQAFDPDMTLIYDGIPVGVYDVQAVYDTDNDFYEFTAMLSNGLKIWMRFSPVVFNQTAYDMLSYIRIANPDGSNAFSSQYNFSRQYFYIDVQQRSSEEQFCNFEFSGKIFADEFNPNSAFHYVTGFSKIHYNLVAPGVNNVKINFYSQPWKILKWQQISNSGDPIQLSFLGYGSYKVQLFFDAMPAVGYYEFNNNSSSNKIIMAKFNNLTLQYDVYNCNGLLHITEVLPDRIKGEFSLSGDLSVNGATFNCQYN